MRFLLTFVLTLGLLASCNKLTTQNTVAPIVFKGLKAIDISSKGTAILLWDRPRGSSTAGFEVFVQDLSATPEASTPAAFRLADETGSSSPLIITDAADDSAPVKLGKLVQILTADKSSFEIPVLLPGRYAIQVKAVSATGGLDTNTRVGVIKVESTLGYEGIASATVVGNEVILKWPALETTLTSRNVIYTVFEGATFENAKAITEATELRLPLLDYRAGTVLYFGVRSTDAKGRTDRNIKTLPVTVPSVEESYAGCVSAEPRGSDRISLTFAWPHEEFEAMRIYRDGTLVYSTRDKGVKEYLDLGLSEGESYSYSCVAVVGERQVTGRNVIRLTTLSSNPPTFAGIKGVELKSAHSALVKWGVSSGVPADAFWIYASPGLEVDWSADPIAKVTGDKLEYLVEGLGDQLMYAFGVRACSIKGVCDFNEYKLTATTVDNGAPKTEGASSMLVASGKLKITAPWKHSDGGISKRLIYLKVNGTAPASVAEMTLAMTIPVADSAHPPVVLEYSPVQDNTTYHVLVIDQDSLNQKSGGGLIRSFFSGDTTKPVFNGQTALLAGVTGFEETTLRAKFIPIESEPTSVIGATSYVAYVAPGNVDACALTVPHETFPAINYTVNVEATVTLSELNPLTLYSVCIKARDLAGNLSENTISSTRSTLDKTAPVFDGLQTLAYDKTKGVLVLSWNPSTATDLFEYSIKLWKNDADPSGVPTLTIKRRATEAVSGTSISRATYAVGSLEDVYALVSACDNAGSVPGGSQNCSQHLDSTAKKLTLADIEPPPGFLGIESEPNIGATIQGQLTVRWIAPSSWNDYRGFTIYTVDNNNELAELQVCPCSGDNCPNLITECTVSSLQPYQTYKLHVRAYDSVGNMTILDPATYSTSKRVRDTTAPSFSSALELNFVTPTVQLAWAPATDNQSSTEPGSDIFYEIYRKKGSTFADPSDPSADTQAAMMGRTAQSVGNTWTDPGGDFESGIRYYYTICAADASGNKTCDGNVKDYLIPDLILPSIASFTSNKTDDAYIWNLNWSATDNRTPNNEILYKIYAKQSNVQEDRATVGDTTIFIQSGVSTYQNVQGPINKDTYIHYMLIAEDNDGNQARAYLTVYSQNKVTLNTIRSTEGPIAGNKMVVVVGDGFKPDVQVKIGDSNCQNVNRYSRKHILCRTPAGTAGTYNVRVVNPDGSSAQLNNAYSYCTGTGCQNICNRSSLWGASFASGNGTEATPYVICSLAHLNAIRTVPYNHYFKVGENIDLAGVTMAPLHNSNGGVKEFQGKFDGDHYAILNWTYNDIAGDGIGLFGIINRSVFKNLGLINFNVTGRNYVGTLAGGAAVEQANMWNIWYSSNLNISGIFSTGKVVGSGNFVGGVIGHAGGIINDVMSFVDVEGVKHVGGIFGRKVHGGGEMEHSGEVISSGQSGECRVGGIAGEWNSEYFAVTNLTNRGTVTCTDASSSNSNRTGGLIGHLYNTGTANFENITNYSTVIGKDHTGGITGAVDNSPFINVKNYGNVTGRWSVGGITGHLNVASLDGVTNFAKITANSSQVGGVAGRVFASSSNPNIWTNVANKGDVINSSDTTGGVAGYAEYTKISLTTNTGNVSTTGSAGGIVGYGRAITLTDVSSTGNITNTSADGTGGIIGVCNNNLGPCVLTKAKASGTITGRSDTGGIAGLFYGKVSQAEFDGDVAGMGRVGGVVGRFEPATSTSKFILEKSKARGTLTGDNKCAGVIGEIKDYSEFRQNTSDMAITCDTIAGGSIGWINGNNILIETSASRGSVKGNTDVGGFFGASYSDHTAAIVIRDSYSRASVTGNDKVGGFAGISGPYLLRVYATGKVSPDLANSNLGGLVGRSAGTGTATDSFWDTVNSTLAVSAWGEGKTTAQMLGGTLYGNYDQAVWSFNNLDYPKLLWEVTPPTP